MAGAVSDSVKHVTFDAPAFVPVLRNSEPLVSSYVAVGEVNKLSAPIKGNSGVFVLQPYAEDKLNETYEEGAEIEKLQDMYTNLAVRQFINDLYLKANVKDERYLFF